MTTLKEHLEHVKHHIKYPASRSEVVAACNAMADLPRIGNGFLKISLKAVTTVQSKC